MYKSFTAQEYLKFFNLSEDYRVDGLLISGTWQREEEQKKLKKTLSELNENAKYETLPDFLASIIVFKVNGKRYWFDTFYGGTLLSEVIHLASLFGSKKNILIGVCGGLNVEGKTGDLIAAEYSDGNESVTRMYNPSAINNRHFSDKNLTESLISRISSKYTVKKGGLVTCQAMMAETQEDVNKWAKEGYLGVEMESSTVFAVSSHFNVPATALISLADNLIANETVLHENFGLLEEFRAEVKLEQYRVAIEELIA